MAHAAATTVVGSAPARGDGDHHRTGLLLVIHGSRLGTDPALPNLVHILSADFEEVGVAVLRGRPTPEEVVAGMSASVVHVVPLLMAQGYVGGALLASLLPFRERARLCLHPPIGSHPGLVALICAHIQRLACERQFRPSDTAAVLVGHGSRRNPAAASAIHCLADGIRARSCGADEVHCAFLSQSPLIEDWRDLTRRRNVVFVPCFLSAGVHVQVDLPALLGIGADQTRPRHGTRQVTVAPHLTSDGDHFADVVRDVVRTPPSIAGPRPYPSTDGHAALVSP
jgi:sirohydrochlorin ferrochelatase